MDELIQYYIINKDLNMSPGKISTQVAHVATIIAEECCYNDPLYIKWRNEKDQKKIVLKGSQKQLSKLAQKFYYIKDLGFTEVPAGSLTCVGLPVMYKSDAKKFVGNLQLL